MRDNATYWERMSLLALLHNLQWYNFPEIVRNGGVAMIKIHLSKLLGERRWSQAYLSRITGIRPTTISEIYNELIERINVDHLDLICEALDCRVEDLLEYVPNKKGKPNSK